MKKTRKWIALLLLLVMAVSTYVVPVSATSVTDPDTCDDGEAHEWDTGTETKAATCEDAGVTTFTCSKCNGTKTEPISAKGHTEVTIAAKDATCTEDGKEAEIKCSVCNKSLSGGKTITKLGHKYEFEPFFEWNLENYMDNVKVRFTCSSCGHIEEVVAKPTSKEDGNEVTYTAKVTFNGKEYSDIEGARKGGYWPIIEVSVTQESLTALSGVYGSQEAIDSAMGQAIQQKVGYGGQNANHKLYDVELKVFKNNGWQPADESDFPEGGLTVYLPYPEGTTKDSYEFTVAHMFTHTMNGKYTVGQIETPSVTKRDDGLYFNVNGLSPIMVAWTQTQGQGAAAGANAKGISGVPQTGDAANVGVLLLCMVVSVAVGAGVVIRKRNGRA